MKIAITISQLAGTAGGAQKSAVELANNMSYKGHDTVIIGFESGGSHAKPHFELAKNVKLRVAMREKNARILSLEPEARPHKVIGRADGMLAEKTKWYISNLTVMNQLATILTEEQPDIVAAFLPSTFTIVSKVLENTGLPFIVANRNDPWVDYTKKRYYANDYDVKMRKRAPEAATANQVLVEQFTNYFSKAVQKKTFTISNPVQPVPVSAKNMSNRKTKVIICTARLEWTKNYPVLIKAFARLAPKHKGWQLHIYGDGGLKEELQNLINSLKMQERILLQGVTKNVDEKLSSADIFVLPSVIEGYSRSLTEAMAHGLPSVVLEKCKSNKYIIGESCGGLVARNNPGDLAIKIGTLINDTQLREELGVNARSFVKKLKPEKIYDAWEKQLIKYSLDDRKAKAESYEKLSTKAAEFERHFSNLLLKLLVVKNEEINIQAKHLKAQKQQLESILNSHSYKLGRTLLAPPRKLKHIRERKS